MRTCTSCETEKRDTDFRKAGRGRKAVCMACEADVAANPAESPPAPVKITAALEVHAGLGFRVSIEDGTLQLEQDRADDDGKVYTHQVSLAPHEARQLVEFVAEQVERAGVA
jgi:hypothetical protein